MQPLDYCNLVARLIINEKYPEGFRTVISRAYYGAFHQAKDFFERISIHLVSTNPHQEILLLLGNTGDADLDLAAGLLSDLRHVRNVADYEFKDKSVEVEHRAQEALDDALDIIAKLNGCRVSPSRLRAVTAQVRITVNRLRGLPP